MSQTNVQPNSTVASDPGAATQAQLSRPQDCFTCRLIGTGALGAVGFYALNMSRAKAPGSPFGKRIMAGVGVGFLFASAFRWTMD
ncbi:hypothetical protein EIP91_002215 [Steccherinum ochraceum]|uniref:Distal membrane-arm assembly complex protein 1-like domain-containing protein n=1 Tax=Steccherinum ochraceum TaxID=92696 RepID=A0A4R0RF12_9APHY|nr:hypothetical protein EIP91_002215 [Steccherinum ochraceum]